MGKLRVFISSTMKDLVNERLAIERQLRQFNFEPVKLFLDEHYLIFFS